MTKLENNQRKSSSGSRSPVSAKTKVGSTARSRQAAPNVLALKVDKADAGLTQEQNFAKHVVTVAEVNATTGIEAWSKHMLGHDLHIVALLEKVEAQTAAIKGGDMSEVEAMLFGQALTLQTVFTTFTRKAAQNLSTNPAGMELCLRLAFKAQSQCRTTLETLAEIKNPRSATFIKQANLAGGHQQVNNNAGASNDSRPHEKTANQPNELLESPKNGEWMDTGTKGRAVKRNPRVEAMGKGHRAAHSVG